MTNKQETIAGLFDDLQAAVDRVDDAAVSEVAFSIFKVVPSSCDFRLYALDRYLELLLNDQLRAMAAAYEVLFAVWENSEAYSSDDLARIICLVDKISQDFAFSHNRIFALELVQEFQARLKTEEGVNKCV